MIIHENIIEERFQQAMDAFKYWSFPFYCKYKSSNVTFNDSNISIVLKIDRYSKHLENLLNYVKNDKTEHKPSIDNHVIKRFFDKKMPFFQWSSKNYLYELKRLLSGQNTTLYADINFARFDAIKFCTLELLIETDEPNSNHTINELLKEFMVEMTHSGESHYKYKQKTFSINMNYQSGEKLLLKYQYGSKDNKNKSYEKLSANIPVLSPYTFWTIKIKAVKKEEEEKLLKNIDLLIHRNIELKVYLYGYGQYVDESIRNTCENSEIDLLF